MSTRFPIPVMKCWPTTINGINVVLVHAPDNFGDVSSELDFHSAYYQIGRWCKKVGMIGEVVLCWRTRTAVDLYATGRAFEASRLLSPRFIERDFMGSHHDAYLSVTSDSESVNGFWSQFS